MEKVLEINNLTKIYKNNRGIRDISLSINRGDVYGILGLNGAGKTTIMKIVTGLCRADSGNTKIFGYDIQTDFEKAMEKVGCIIENAAAYDYMTAYKNLEVASRFYNGINSGKIEETLDTVGLLKYKDERVSNFSLGMKQRMGLALSILSNPEFIILDEPTNGLDAEGMVDIRNTIKKLAHDKNITFFISSHLIHEMELTCNRVGIIDNGRLVAEGNVADLLKGQNESLEDYFIGFIKEGRRNVVNE